MSTNQSRKETSSARRKFLTRTGTGLLIASIPAKSVWAQSIAGSIAASGHSSDWAEGEAMTLQSHGHWYHPNRGVHDASGITSNDSANLLLGSFKEMFGSPLDGNSNDFQLWQGLAAGDNGRKGEKEENVHMQMITLWLNAAYTDINNYTSGFDKPFYYPIIGSGGGQFSSKEAFAQHLYSLAAPLPGAAGYDFGCLISNYHSENPEICV